MSTLPLTAPHAEAAPVEATAALRRKRLSIWATSLVQGNTTYALLDQGVYSFGNMVVAALLSRHCTAWEFGVYILTQRAMDVLIQLSNVFLWGPYTFHLPGMDPSRRARYQGSIVTLQVVFALCFTLLLYVAARWTAHSLRPDLYATFFPLVLASGALLFREFTRRLYFAHLRLREALATDVATVVLQIAGVAWLLRGRRLHVASALYLLSCAAAVVSLWWLVREWSKWQVSAGDTLADFRRDLDLGRWFFGSNMVFLAGAQCNPWVLSAVLGGASVGSYAIAESLVNIPRVALTSLQNMMGPTLARAQVEGGKSQVALLVSRFNRKLLVVSLGSAIMVCSLGPTIARLIYHRAPRGTREIAFWLALNFVVYACTLAQSYALSAVGRASAVFYVNSAGLVGQAAVCLSLIHHYQISGAAIALLLGSVIVLLARQWVYAREMA